jgi:GMP synthase (glutamine-hydrolysing)
MKHDSIAVIDFGGQYAHLIATKVRRAHVLAEIRQPEDPIGLYENYKGIIISGSPSLSSHGEDSGYNKEIFDLDMPILGFCFGHQEIAKHYGGMVVHGGREWGPASFRIARPHPLFAGLSGMEQVFMSHFDSVISVGPGFEELGHSFLADESDIHRYAAIGSDRLRRYGFQFHPEVDDTVHGDEMIANFVLGICGCSPTWTMDRFLEEQVEAIRRKVGTRSVFLLASGGVDSTVAARVLGEAVGTDRLHMLHIDNGLMRKGESAAVLEMFKDLGLDKNLYFADASAEFIGALEGVIEPERKRRIIGDTFIRVFQREGERLGIEGHLLGQGTIYPDTIETGGTKRADTIKTHHNRVPIIEKLISEGKVVEPLSELYKVEVRELGEKLGIPRDALWRHPFPGPGLGVRLLCASGGHDMAEVARIEPQVRELASEWGMEALVLPIKSVGVKADLRSYEHPVMLCGEAAHEKLTEAAGEIFKKVPGVNRCVANLAEKAPRHAAPRRATVTRERLDLLREADHLVMEGLKRHGIYDEIWQCPTVLVPMVLDGKAGELVIIRPVHSERAMTARAAPLPQGLIKELRSSILALPGVVGLALDVTSKPPGTIEWE